MSWKQKSTAPAAKHLYGTIFRVQVNQDTGQHETHPGTIPNTVASVNAPLNGNPMAAEPMTPFASNWPPLIQPSAAPPQPVNLARPSTLSLSCWTTWN